MRDGQLLRVMEAFNGKGKQKSAVALHISYIPLAPITAPVPLILVHTHYKIESLVEG
jgi:hypothetical protein